MKKYNAWIALLLAAVMLFSLAACGAKSDPKPDDTTPSGDSQTVDGETEPSTPDDQPQPQPQPEPQPQPQPEPTPEPQPKPEPSPAPADLTGDYTGEFTSRTETPLELVVKWSAKAEADGSYAVTLRVYLSTFSLYVGERNTNTIKIVTAAGTTERTFHSDAVEKKDNEHQELLLHEETFRLTSQELLDGAEVSVTWDFRGSYGDKELPSVTAAGTIQAK